MLSALMNQASDLLQQTRDRLNASAAALAPASNSTGDAQSARAVPALEKSDGEGVLERFDRNATTLRLSARARLQTLGNEGATQSNGNSSAADGLTQGNLGQAVSAAIEDLRNQLEEVFSALGLDGSQAAAAADAARDAVTGATRSESFQLQLSQITAQETSIRESDGDSYYGASLVAEQLEVSYDAENGVFRASVVRVSISVEIGTGDFADDVGAGTLLNADGNRLDLDDLLEGVFFNGRQLTDDKGDQVGVDKRSDVVENSGNDSSDVAVPNDRTEAMEAEVGAENSGKGDRSPLILISTPQSERADAGEIPRNFRVDLLLRVAPAEWQAAGSVPAVEASPAENPAVARPDPVNILV